MSPDTIRLWRIRKDHAWIDARLSAGEHPAGARVDFFYDGDCIFSRDFRSRDLAVAEAQARLRDLQRAGWNTHW